MSDPYINIGSGDQEWARKTLENGEYINEAEDAVRNTNGFNETKVAQNTTQIALNNNLPLSSFRDIQTGNITKQGSEYRVRADGSNNTSSLRTALRGNYISGHVLTPGLGVRIPTLPTGDQFVEWGYYELDANDDPLNGITFKRTSDTVLLNLYKDGTNQLGGGSGVPQEDWNKDKLDGTGTSGANLSTPTGYVYRVPFIYYGYGPVEFLVGVRSKNGVWREFPIHSADLDEGTSIAEPNLPLTVTTYNGGDSSTLDAFVGGRQIAVSGPDKAVEPRIVGSEVREKSVGTTVTPLISFQHKSGRENIRVKLKDLYVESDIDLHIFLYRNVTLSAGTTTYSTPVDYDSNETATEWNGNSPTDIGATAFTGGERFGGSRYVPVGSQGSASAGSTIDLPQSVLIEGENWTLAAQTRSSTATVNAGLNVAEEW